MKHYLNIFLIITLLLILSISFRNYTTPENKKQKLTELKNFTRKIESISPKDTNFEDLSFLKQTLRNKDIVLLGEQTHSDGSTFMAKSRFIKFLHQELGYSVLLYETGLYDTENLWNSLKIASARNIDTFVKALYPFWYDNFENKELLTYIIDNLDTKNEIRIARFDVQFSGKLKDSERDSLLTQYLKSKPKIKPERFPAFFSVKSRYNYYSKKWVANKLAASKKDSILNDIQSINQILKDEPIKNKIDSLYIKFFNNLGVLYTYSWKYKLGSDDRFHIRDSIMAENFIWLKENNLKIKK